MQLHPRLLLPLPKPAKETLPLLLKPSVKLLPLPPPLPGPSQRQQ